MSPRPIRDVAGNVVDDNGIAWYVTTHPKGYTAQWSQADAYDGGPPPRIFCTEQERIDYEMEELL